MKRQTLLLLSSIALLTLAILSLFWANFARSHFQEPWEKLENRLPREIAGWSSVDLPLADTELVREAVENHLNFDDYLYRQYSKGGESVFVYAMFWRQGRISVREMAGHTPDGCWLSNGAEPVGERKRASLDYFGGRIKPGEFRYFRFPRSNDPVNVLWWHVWGGEIVPAGFVKKSPITVLHELWTWLWVRRGRPADQIFIRIHTMGELNASTPNPVVVRFLELFPELQVLAEAK